MKERTLILFFVLLLISFVCFCDDLELMISCPKGEMVLGCPISIPTEIRNLSGKPITLSYKSLPLKFVKLETRDEEGKIVDIEPERRVLDMPALDSQKIEIEANGKKVIATGVDYIKKAGKYTAKAIFESKGPYYYLENGKLVQFQAWEGRIESEICQFEVKAPTGIDLEAYNYFKGEPLSKPQELLQKFPTSTYAGYELAKDGCEDLENYVNLTSDEIIDDVLGVRWRPDRDTYKEEVKAKYSEKLKMLRNFILAHPDFAEADMIHSAIARSLLILGRQNEAIEEMKILSKMEGKFAEGARRAIEKIDQEKCKAKTNEEINKNERKSNPEGKKE